MNRLFLLGVAAVLLNGCGKSPPTRAGGKPVRYWVQAVHAADARLRKTAVFKLGNVGPTDPAAFPAVLGALKDQDAGVRIEAILALMKFGPAAREALPVLNELRNDPDARVRGCAAKALKKIGEEENRAEAAACEQVVVPFAAFPPSGDGTAPDFAKLRLTDYGRTIALGAYEASADAILYETDRDYRKKLNRQRRASERSFGASLLRLRKQRQLGRGDFAPLSAKTIARIERNEIAKPHGKTLRTLADRLGVRQEEIGEY